MTSDARRPVARPARRTFVATASAAALAAALWPAPLRANLAGDDDLEDALCFFDQMALMRREGDDGPAEPGWVRKWTGPVAVRLAGARSPRIGFELAAVLGQLSRWTGLPFRLTDARVPGAGAITIAVRPHAEIVRRFGAGGNVCECATYGWDGRLHTGSVEVSDRFADCLRHELMHAIGFDNHWSGDEMARPVRSVLAPRYTAYRSETFSRWDALAIRTLYDRRLVPGTRREIARPIARAVVSSLLAA